MTRLAYHYTTGVTLRTILAEGAIPVGKWTSGPFGTRPAVWFTRCPNLEVAVLTVPARAKMVEALGGGLARIGVAIDGLTTWAEHTRLAGVEASGELVVVASLYGQRVEDWLASFAPVARARFVAIERWDAVTSTWLEHDAAKVRRVN